MDLNAGEALKLLLDFQVGPLYLSSIDNIGSVLNLKCLFLSRTSCYIKITSRC